jgi:hypothetical protein
MRAVFNLDDTYIEVVEPTVVGPFPWLIRVGNQNLAARAGHLDSVGGGESASLEVAIDNTAKQAANVFGYPLRAPVEVYDDEDELIMVGLVQSIRYGDLLTLQVED